MWYLWSWRDLRRRSNAGHGLLNKPEITPPSHSNHHRAGTGGGVGPTGLQRVRPLCRDGAAVRRHGLKQVRVVVPGLVHARGDRPPRPALDCNLTWTLGLNNTTAHAHLTRERQEL